MITRLRNGIRLLARRGVLACLTVTAAACDTEFLGFGISSVQYRVVVHGAGSGSGRVVGGRPDAPIDCRIEAGVADPQSTCVAVGTAERQSQFRLTATPNPSSTIGGTSTDCFSDTGFCQLDLYGGDYEVTATFTLVPPLPAYDTELLTSPGFESPVAVGSLPADPGIWRGDLSQSTTVERGVTPREGSRMLRFDATGPGGPGLTFVSSQQWQLVDVRGYRADIDAGRVTVDASVWFNRAAGTAASDTRFDLIVMAFNGSPSTFPTRYVSGNGRLDAALAEVIAFPLAWERARLSFVLPAGTTYLAFEIYAYENITDDATNEFDGHYADQASLILRVTP